MKNKKLNQEIEIAVKAFWSARAKGKGVLAGKTLSSFVDIFKTTITQNGLEDAAIETGRNASQLPGFFRPHKAWDLIIREKNELVAAIELKSQVGSIGNNFNNRTEEVLGSGLDLNTAIGEDVLGDAPKIFRGYLMVAEDGPGSRKEPKIQMNYFRVMDEFIRQDSDADLIAKEKYHPKKNDKFPGIFGISYLQRYDLLCKRLMNKGIYDAAAILTVNSEEARQGEFGDLSPETSLETFLERLAAHCRVWVSIKKQRASKMITPTSDK